MKGNLKTSGNIRLEGKVIGDISSKSKVACGETSIVDGNVIAENAEIAGKVTGKVTVSELLILKSTAIVICLDGSQKEYFEEASKLKLTPNIDSFKKNASVYLEFDKLF